MQAASLQGTFAGIWASCLVSHTKAEASLHHAVQMKQKQEAITALQGKMLAAENAGDDNVARIASLQVTRRSALILLCFIYMMSHLSLLPTWR